MLATDLLARLREHGYTVTLEDGRLKVRGPRAPRPELERMIVENRDALKACVLLSNPPGWLAKLFELYASGRETRVRRIDPEKGGIRRYPVRVSLENIAAAVAAEIGMAASELAGKEGFTELVCAKAFPEVEEVARSWEAA